MRLQALLTACATAVLLLCVLVLSASSASAILTSVNAGEVFTVTEAVPAGTVAVFAYQLHPEYLLPVSAKLRDSGETVQTWKDQDFGSLNIPAADKQRVFHFSFDNSASMLTSVNVNFEIRLIYDPDFNFDSTQLDPIEKKVRELFDKVHIVKGLQQTLRYQQKNHRATVEDANERVLLWSILQVVGFVLVLVGQLYLLKTFLEKKRTI